MSDRVEWRPGFALLGVQAGFAMEWGAAQKLWPGVPLNGDHPLVRVIMEGGLTAPHTPFIELVRRAVTMRREGYL